MTSWPWMNGVEEAIADPIPPVNEYDTRPSVKDLIRNHRLPIDEVREGLQRYRLFEGSTKHDDLWILRFVLSHKGNVKKALSAAKGSLLFRHDMKLGDKDIRGYDLSKPGCDSEALKRYWEYCQEDFACGAVPDLRLGVIIFLRFASLDQHGVVDNVAEEDWLPTFTYVNEWSFQWCDYVTRTTGRLTKMVRICDCHPSDLSIWNKECSRRDTTAMNTMEDFYPQLLAKVFICNVPTWVQIPWRVFRRLAPKRMLSKMDMISPVDNEEERETMFPFITEENLPVRFGGTHKPWPPEYPRPISKVISEKGSEATRRRSSEAKPAPGAVVSIVDE